MGEGSELSGWVEDGVVEVLGVWTSDGAVGEGGVVAGLEVVEATNSTVSVAISESEALAVVALVSADLEGTVEASAVVDGVVVVGVEGGVVSRESEDVLEPVGPVLGELVGVGVLGGVLGLGISRELAVDGGTGGGGIGLELIVEGDHVGEGGGVEGGVGSFSSVEVVSELGVGGIGVGDGGGGSGVKSGEGAVSLGGEGLEEVLLVVGVVELGGPLSLVGEPCADCGLLFVDVGLEGGDGGVGGGLELSLSGVVGSSEGSLSIGDSLGEVGLIGVSGGGEGGINLLSGGIGGSLLSGHIVV